MYLKILLILTLLTGNLAADDLEDIFLGKVDRSTLKGKRVTVSGVMDAKGCKKEEPCKLLLKRKIKGAYVILSLTYKKKYAPSVGKKWVTTPIVATCVYENPFTYTDCMN